MNREEYYAPPLTAGAIIWRLFGSLLVFSLYSVLNIAFNPVQTLVVGEAARTQFENTDNGYLHAIYTINVFSWPGLIFTFLLIAILGAIWWEPLRRGVNFLVASARDEAPGLIVAGLLTGMALVPDPAQAYYNKTDWPEIYFVLPNESAFYIPDAGANKDSQTAFGSEQYLAENKIAAKRFQIPHTKLTGSSYGFDFYVPAGRLIVVDRTPYAREWTVDEKRGTSKDNQALACQSKEGLDITIEIAISAAVFEQDAPKFLYRFGVKPPVGDRSNDEVKFVSVFQGKSLTEVMDTVVHGKIQTLVCGFFSVKSLDEVNAQMAEIINSADEKTREYLKKEFGITLDYLGLAGSPSFSPTVQKAIDDKYAAERITPVMPILERQTQLKIQEGIAEGIRAFGKGIETHGLPSNLIAIPENLMGVVKNFAPPAAAPKP